MKGFPASFPDNGAALTAILFPFYTNLKKNKSAPLNCAGIQQQSGSFNFLIIWYLIKSWWPTQSILGLNIVNTVEIILRFSYVVGSEKRSNIIVVLKLYVVRFRNFVPNMWPQVLFPTTKSGQGKKHAIITYGFLGFTYIYVTFGSYSFNLMLLLQTPWAFRLTSFSWWVIMCAKSLHMLRLTVLIDSMA